MINVSVEFGDYISDTLKERIANWTTALSGGASTFKTAVEGIHPDWTRERVNEEINTKRYEQGMAADNPNNLPELTGMAGEPQEPQGVNNGGNNTGQNV